MTRRPRNPGNVACEVSHWFQHSPSNVPVQLLSKVPYRRGAWTGSGKDMESIRRLIGILYTCLRIQFYQYQPPSSLFFQDQVLPDTDRLHLNLAKSKIFKHPTIHNALYVGFTNQFIVISVQTKKVWEIGSKQNG
jgi:hypothetical protein